jgi:hypothetical protein
MALAACVALTPQLRASALASIWQVSREKQ